MRRRTAGRPHFTPAAPPASRSHRAGDPGSRRPASRHSLQAGKAVIARMYSRATAPTPTHRCESARRPAHTSRRAAPNAPWRNGPPPCPKRARQSLQIASMRSRQFPRQPRGVAASPAGACSSAIRGAAAGNRHASRRKSRAHAPAPAHPRPQASLGKLFRQVFQDRQRFPDTVSPSINTGTLPAPLKAVSRDLKSGVSSGITVSSNGIRATFIASQGRNDQDE